jgi:hypothetical protein
MPTSKPVSYTAIVAGDVTVDWNIARTRRSKISLPAWRSGSITRTWWQPGGAALLADLLTAIAGELRQSSAIDASIRKASFPGDAVQPGDPRFHHSYSIWSPFKAGEKPPLDREKPIWRMEEYLGLHPASPIADTTWMTIISDTSQADLLVLDDAALGFRSNEELWPIALKQPGFKPWVLLKMACPVAQGDLWEALLTQHAARTVVIMTIDDLRLSEVQISRELSWERTAQDLAWELVHNPSINGLSRCAAVIISFGAAGAVLLKHTDTGTGDASQNIKCELFFDPRVIEGMWEIDYPGGMIGYTTCLIGGLSRQMLLSPGHPDLAQGLQSGLAALRKLHREGYGEPGSSATEAPIVFPVQKISEELARPAALFSVVEIPDPLHNVKEPHPDQENTLMSGAWSILKDRAGKSLDSLPEQIVLEGPETALRGIPLGQFGNLLAVDRQEIEGYRSIRSLVGEYCRQGQQKRPLSIAVFGAPGSGKSFGITEVAKSLLPGQIEVLEFNLSQMDSPTDLLAALHRVPDIGLVGKIPLVFWDEFDTSLDGQPLGWLRLFLAPMQDGKFQEGQIAHPIGRSIFVFAGGTSTCMDDFGKGLDLQEYRRLKGPDFISRLKGYINVLGPNQQAVASCTSGNDSEYIIRRAILLRSLFKRNAPHLFEKRDGKEILNIDKGVLRALLETRTYKHGVRSIESVIAMSLLTGKTSFERSCLPSEDQLDLHVDGRDFIALVQRMELDGELLEKLAQAAHEVFCDGLRLHGYRLGPVTSLPEKTHAALLPYNELPEDLKEQNRKNVRDIPEKLSSLDYVMLPARSGEPAFKFNADDLERLARIEHERWKQARLDDGWVFEPQTDQARKVHGSLVPWDELPEAEKEKDRDMVSGIPAVLARAGYTVMQSHSS